MQYRGAVSAVFGGNGAKNTDAVLYGALPHPHPQVISFLQQNLVKAGDEDGEPEDDPDFIAEGRKILALDRWSPPRP